MQPDNLIINSIPILQQHFHYDFLGVNIIYSPKEARSVLVVFDLETDNLKHRFGVILPGPDDYAFKAYEYFLSIHKLEINVKFDTYFFPSKLDLTQFDDSLNFIKKWNEFNSLEVELLTKVDT